MSKEKTKNFLNHPLLIVVFTCLCFLIIFSLRESSKKALVSKESIEKLETSIQSLEKEVANENDKLQNSRQEIAVERIMRNELLRKKEGEIVLQIPDEEQNKEEKTDLKKEKSGPWEEWKKLLQ